MLPVGFALIALVSGTQAQDAVGCKALAWPLDQERAAFVDPKLEIVESGSARGPWTQQAFALMLAPQESVAFKVPPGDKRRPEGKVFGGTVSFDAPAQAELYYVTLSSEGWIDVVQNGAAIRSDAHTGAKGCPDVRKSVRFPVGSFPIVLQLSGVPATTIKIGIRPVRRRAALLASCRWWPTLLLTNTGKFRRSPPAPTAQVLIKPKILSQI